LYCEIKKLEKDLAFGYVHGITIVKGRLRQSSFPLTTFKKEDWVLLLYSWFSIESRDAKS